jgi:hypothetical protein
MNDRIDALGPRPDRLSAFTGDLLSQTEDEELKAIVAKAAQDLSMPIALVNLVLEHIQFFKAQHGLPEDLVAARGTHRDVSFCQYVVRLGEPFEVTDAEKDERIPQQLVRHYGIRSYLGMPIVANEEIVGSLCVIDYKPRNFTGKDRQQLRDLAELVNHRLSQLAARRKASDSPTRDQSLTKSIETATQALSPIAREIQHGRSDTLAISAFLRLMDFSLQSDTVPTEIIEQTLKAAKEALRDSLDRYSNIEMDAEQAQAAVRSIQSILQPATPTNLKLVAEAVIDLHQTLLDTVGGCTLEISSPSLYISSDRPLAVSVTSVCLTTLAGHMLKEQLREGIRLQLASENARPSIKLYAKNLSDTSIQNLARQLIQQIKPADYIAIRAQDNRLQILFNRAKVG